MFLALDLGTKTGWARWDEAIGQPVSGVETFDDSDLGRRARDYRAWLLRKVEYFDVRVMAVEAPLPGMKKQSNFAAEMWQPSHHVLSQEVAVTCGVKYISVPMQTWRKHFLGRGRAPKETRNSRKWMKEAAKARCRQMGWKVSDDNEAEALGILDLIRARNSQAYAVHSTPLFHANQENNR